jgi:2-dehydro-3-deoxyphosphogluconate aldolase/(4S)-4-hydroxy-2-oxoglutarate aldolase
MTAKELPMAPDPLPIEDILTKAPVIPVLIIPDVAIAVPLARALVRGGLPVLEVTLRTPSALDVIRCIAEEVPDAIVGAGTVIRPGQYGEAVHAGAQFIVSPGNTRSLVDAADGSTVPWLPGAASASEVMTLLDAGYTRMKLFPAEVVGGLALLKALASPLPEVRFCPTGGIDIRRAPEYLAQPNVLCIGGSWVTPADAVAAGDWDRIEALAREAAALKR